MSFHPLKLVPFVLIIFGCNGSLFSDFSLNKFIESKSEYDGYIIHREDGLHRLTGTTITDSTFGIIAVHGYYPRTWPTKGFEWIPPLKKLSELEIPIWFLKYDWENCPDSSAIFLANQIDFLINDFGHLDSIWVMGHSLGGLVSTLFAKKTNVSVPITVHSIAAPLTGMSRSISNCTTDYSDEYIIDSLVNYTQWKTDHQSDGAFRHLDDDPQKVKIINGRIVELPKNWNGGRLGHNRSLQFVAEKLVLNN